MRTTSGTCRIITEAMLFASIKIDPADTNGVSNIFWIDDVWGELVSTESLLAKQAGMFSPENVHDGNRFVCPLTF